MEIRIGNGYDIHQLIEGRDFILGNIVIPHDKGFKAHSDGDVLIHAIIDALLGASNQGDIGTLFPDTDPVYKNIDSSTLLERTVKLITDKGYAIINMDCTIICEKPKLKEHIPVIKRRLAEIVHLNAERISLKAKTKEKLDAVGEGKAVEVFCSCLLSLNKPYPIST